jgi:hypothetical protein
MKQLININYSSHTSKKNSRTLYIYQFAACIETTLSNQHQKLAPLKIGNLSQVFAKKDRE